jgi:undecaprenol kinase/diacylglycerol kinase (ATP)
MAKWKNILKSRVKSFSYAFQGLKLIFKEELNARIHLVAKLGAIALSIILDISLQEWVAIIIAIGMVISAELLNTAIENLSDFSTTEHHELIKKTKDYAAAAVLVTAIMALVIGCIIFIPKIIEMVK